MSYVGASDPRELYVLLGGMGAIVGSLALWTVREAANPGRVVAECADGSVIGGWRDRVRRRPGRSPAQRERLARRFPELSTFARRQCVDDELSPGDLCYARVREGKPGEGAWIVEGLDADGQHLGIDWEFETVDDAWEAYRLIEARVVRPPAAATGGDAPRSNEDFDRLIERERLAAEHAPAPAVDPRSAGS
jgi:hypothetical protein